MRLAPSGRTLIVQPLPGIGDMIWHLPHIHAIAATTTPGKVDILTKPRSQADRLLCADPCVGQVLWLERESGPHAGWRGLLRLAAKLRQGGYQRAWILHGSARYALAARWAGISERLGYGVGLQSAAADRAGAIASRAAPRSPDPAGGRLVGCDWAFPATNPSPGWRFPAEAERAVAARFAAWPAPWIALGVGSSEPWKQWGAVRFAELALVLRRRRAGSIFIVGGPAEQALAEDVLARVHAGGGEVVAAVALPLEQVAALLARCRWYIGNDTGALNMAAALQVSAIGLFGGSTPLWHSRLIHPLLPPRRQSVAWRPSRFRRFWKRSRAGVSPMSITTAHKVRREAFL
jgi:heptosyltransferase-2